MFVIAISVITAIPASLHTNMIGVHGYELRVVDLAIDPDIGCIAIRPLSDDVVLVDV